MTVVYKSFEEEFTATMVQMQDDILDVIGNGQAPDYAEYKRVCGNLQGLKNAHDIFMQLVEKYHNE